MTDPTPNVIARIRTLLAASPASTTPTPANIAALLEVIIEMEPTAVEMLPVIFPGNALVTAAVALVPTLLPVLQTLESALASL